MPLADFNRLVIEIGLCYRHVIHSGHGGSIK